MSYLDLQISVWKAVGSCPATRMACIRIFEGRRNVSGLRDNERRALAAYCSSGRRVCKLLRLTRAEQRHSDVGELEVKLAPDLRVELPPEWGLLC